MMLLAHDHYNFRAFKKTLSGLGSASVISKTAKAAAAKVISLMLAIRIAWVLLTALSAAACSAWGQEAVSADDVRSGRDLAIMICANCHVVARDQPYKPILKPPAPPFKSIVRREIINSDWVKNFLTTTHRGLDNPKR